MTSPNGNLLEVKDLRTYFETEDGTVKAVDRKSTRLNSSHLVISYAVFCLKKKKTHRHLADIFRLPQIGIARLSVFERLRFVVEEQRRCTPDCRGHIALSLTASTIGSSAL